LRDLALVPESSTRVCEELGVGKGEFEGVLLGPGMRVASSERSCNAELAIGGKEGEKTEGGRVADLI